MCSVYKMTLNLKLKIGLFWIFYFMTTFTATSTSYVDKNTTFPKCSSECSVSSLQTYKLFRSYEYDYNGVSSVHFEGVPNAVTQLHWSATVDFYWVTPCDFMMRITNPIVMGDTDSKEMEDLLTKQSLMVSMSDGMVQRLCVHPDEQPISLNIKKGIISSIQKSLPSLSPIYNGKTMQETDVAGKCQTLYNIEVKEDTTIVKKFKNHKLCENRYGSAAESAVSSWWLKSSLPLQDSHSTCIQNYKDGIVNKVLCKDVNVAKPMFGAYKFIKAEQQSKFTFKRINYNNHPLPMKELYYTNLAFEYIPDIQTNTVIPEINRILKEVCVETELKMSENTPKLMSKVIELLHKAPENLVPDFLQRIRDGMYCKNYHRLEQLYLDAVSFIDQAGAVKVMVDEVMNRNVSWDRELLYSVGIHLMKRPSLDSLEAARTLINAMKRLSPPMILATGNLVKVYCRYHKNCEKQPFFYGYITPFINNLAMYCLEPSDTKDRLRAMTYIKTMGNLGSNNGDILKVLKACALSTTADIPVRIAAIQAVRNNYCNDNVTKEIQKMILHTNETTEIRIESYLEAVRCPRVDVMKKIVNHISNEKDEQVRNFILSHMNNVKNGNDPEMNDLKKILINILIPNDYVKYGRKLSYNAIIFYYLKSIGLGGGIDDNVLFDGSSLVPRQLRANITADMFNTFLNIFEIGLRFENFDHILNSPLKALLNVITEEDIIIGLEHLIQSHGDTLLNIIDRVFKNTSYASIIQNIIRVSKHKPDNLSKFDAFLRLFNHEIGFVTIEKDFNKLTPSDIQQFWKQLLMEICIYFESFLYWNANIARMMEFNFNYFVPTIQGIPLQLKLKSTTLLGLHYQSNSPSSANTILHVIPSLASSTDIVVAYDLAAKTGVIANSDLVSSSEFKVILDEQSSGSYKIHIDFPSKTKALKLTGETYLFKKMPNYDEIRVVPKGFIDPRKIGKLCFKYFDYLGLNICVQYNIPDITKNKYLPLGRLSSIDFLLVKSELITRGIEITSNSQKTPDVNIYKWNLRVPGSLSPDRIESTFLLLPNYSAFEYHSLKTNTYAGKSFKLDMKLTPREDNTLYESMMYFSNSKKFTTNDKMASFEVKKTFGEKTTRYDVSFNTHKNLKEYINSLLEVQFDIVDRNDYLNKLLIHRFEFNTECGGFNILSFIRSKQLKSPNNILYATLLQILHRNNNVLRLQGNTHILSSPVPDIISIGSNVAIDTPSNKYSLACNYINSTKLYKHNLNIHKNDNKRIIHHSMAYEKNLRHPLLRNTEIEIDIPNYLPSYTITANVTDNGSTDDIQNLNVMYILQKFGTSVVTINGPYIRAKTPETTEQKLSFTLRGIDKTEPYVLTNKYFQDSEKTNIQLMISNGTRTLVNYKNHIVIKNIVDAEVDTELYIYNIGRCRFNGKIELNGGHGALNLLLKPKTKYEQTLKFFGNVDVNEKSLELNMASHDHSKKFIIKTGIKTNYNVSAEDRLLFFKGIYYYNDDTYHYNLLGSLGNNENLNTKHHILIDFVKPDHSNFIGEYSYKLTKVDEEKGDIKSLIKWKQFNNKEFKTDTKICYIHHRHNSSMVVMGKVILATPWFNTVVIEVVSKTKAENSLKSLHTKLDISQQNRKPLTALIDASVDKWSYMTAIKIYDEKDTQFHMNSTGQIAYGSSRFMPSKMYADTSIVLPMSSIKNIQMYFLKDPENKVVFYFNKNNNPLLYFITSKEDKKWKIDLYSPSAFISATANILSSDLSVGFYPDSTWVSANKKHIHESTKLFYIYPQSKNYLMPSLKTKNIPFFLTKLPLLQRSSRALVEVKVSPSKTDQISVSIVSIDLAKGSRMTEAIFTSKLLVGHPRILAQTSFTSYKKSIKLSFTNEVSKPPSVIIMGSIDTTEFQKNIYASFKTKFDTVEVAVNVQKLFDVDCRGSFTNFTLTSKTTNGVTATAKTCMPWYLLINMNKIIDIRGYTIEMGTKNPAEFSLQISNQNSKEKKVNQVFKAGAHIYNNLFLMVDWVYLSEGIQTFIDEYIYNYLLNISVMGGHIVKGIIEEIFQQPFYPDSSKFVNKIWAIFHELKLELSHIIDQLIEEGILPDFRTWADRVKEFFENIGFVLYKLLESIRRAIYGIYAKLYHITMKVFEQIDSGIKQLLVTIVEKLDNIVDYIQNAINHIKWDIERMLASYKNNYKFLFGVTQKCVSTAVSDIRKMVGEIQEIGTLWDIFSWIRHFVTNLQELKETSIIKPLMKKMISFYIDENESYIHAVLPLASEQYNLKSAFKDINLPLPTVFGIFDNDADFTEKYYINNNGVYLVKAGKVYESPNDHLEILSHDASESMSIQKLLPYKVKITIAKNGNNICNATYDLTSGHLQHSTPIVARLFGVVDIQKSIAAFGYNKIKTSNFIIKYKSSELYIGTKSNNN